MKIFYRVSIILFYFFFVSGCAVNYVGPTTGPTAGFSILDVDTNVGVYKDAQKCKGFQSFPIALFRGRKPFKVPAGKLQTFSASFAEADYYTCDPVTFSFVPKPNNHYQIDYAPHKVNGRDKCLLTVINLTTKNKVKFYPRLYESNFWSGKGQCTPLKM